MDKLTQADDLIIANRELAFQSEEKGKRAAELIIANIELAFQNKEKEKRAAELIIANAELTFQNNEKEKRAIELIIANAELLFQNEEKEKRAAELIIANKELAFQNKEKESRAAELVIANKELAFQNKEKEKRAAELAIANKELLYQNGEKEKRAAELEEVNKELESFSYSVSHDLRSTLRAISSYTHMLEKDCNDLLDPDGKRYLQGIRKSAGKMDVLIDALLAFSRLGRHEVKKILVNINALTTVVLHDIDQLTGHDAEVKIHPLHTVSADPILMVHIFAHLMGNAIKYSSKTKNPFIEVSSIEQEGEIIFCVCDNGVGFDMQYSHKLFSVFQRLHTADQFEGIGVGLAIVKRIIDKHGGRIWAKSEIGKGSSFYFSLPAKEINTQPATNQNSSIQNTELIQVTPS